MKIFIAIPPYRNIQCPQFITSMCKTLKLLWSLGHEIVFSVLPDKAYAEMFKNGVAYELLDRDCDALFFINDDLEFDPKDVVKMLDMKYDICCAAYRKKDTPEEFSVVIDIDDNDIPVHRPDGTISVNLGARGFLKIPGCKLEELQRTYPTKYTDPSNAYDFSLVIKEHGGKIWLVPDVSITHHSETSSLNGNFLDYIKGNSL